MGRQPSPQNLLSEPWVPPASSFPLVHPKWGTCEVYFSGSALKCSCLFLDQTFHRIFHELEGLNKPSSTKLKLSKLPTEP